MEPSFKPLFPAYPSLYTTQEGKKEWLSNSSFTDSALKQASESIINGAGSSSIVEKCEKRKNKHKSKKKKKQTTTCTVPSREVFQLKKKTFKEQATENAFYTDIKPDAQNLMFECFEKSKIAKYHKGLKFSSNENYGSVGAKQRRYFDRKFFKLHKRLNSVSVSKELMTQSLEYIPINALSNLETKECMEKESREKTVFYNKSLSEDSGNVNLWLDFVDFQDSFDLNCRQVEEKKLAILEKALKHNPTDIDLNIRKLKICESCHSSEQMTCMWDNLIHCNPHNVKVWDNFLLFHTSNLTTCANTQMLFANCLKCLLPEDVQSKMAIFHRLCSILESCGYPERGIYLYQALVEFNLFGDPQVLLFEPFWESGAPRVGEKDAAGWAETIIHKKITLKDKQIELEKMEDEILSKKLPLSETWLEFERLRDKHLWLPSINDDRCLAFYEVSPFLFKIAEECNQFLLVTNFISYLGFNVHTCAPTDSSMWIDSSILRELNNPLLSSHHIWTEERFNLIHNIFKQVCAKFSEDYQILVNRLWIKFQKFYIIKIKNKNKDDLKKLKKFIRGILQQPINRNSLVLWTEYLHVERLCDVSSATKSFRTLLHSSISMGCINEILYLVEQFVDLVSFKEVLWILFHVTQLREFASYSNQEISSSMILKTVSTLKSLLTKACEVEPFLCYCLAPSCCSVVSCAKCLAHVRYFSTNCDAALETYENAISLVEDSHIKSFWKSHIKEELCTAAAELLDYHTWHNASESMKPLQNFLHQSVGRYPTNVRLLSLLLKLKNTLLSPTRRLLREILQKQATNPIIWLFALTAELKLCQTLCGFSLGSNHGIHWRIRSLFEKILKSNACGHIPILWRAYLKFEIMTHNTEKALHVFHRALQSCSWSKDLLMDGVTYFPEQLKTVVALMEEKQIGLHTTLEEVTLLMEHGNI